MKSKQCAHFGWHRKCLREIECDDGTAFICECACHQLSELTLDMIDDAVKKAQQPEFNCPPPYPLPFDHGKYRVAEEPLGTDPMWPWVLDYCLECKEPTWTHNARVAGRHESLCETCAYLMLAQHHEERVKAETRHQGTVNPWR